MKREERIDNYIEYWINIADVYANQCAENRITVNEFLDKFKTMLMQLRFFYDYIEEFDPVGIKQRIKEYGATWNPTNNWQYEVDKNMFKLRCYIQRKAEQDLVNKMQFPSDIINHES